MRKAWASTIFAFVVLVGCNGGSSPTTPKENGATPESTPSAEATPAAKTGKVKITETAAGKGYAAKPGDTIWVSYVGKLKSNGKVFDSTEKAGGKPFTVTLGAGQVIKGWDDGLVGVKKGTKRTLDIPYDLAYGDAGSGDSIPPRADLIFDVEVFGVLKPEDEGVIESSVIKAGSGPAIAEGDTVTIDYVLKLANDLEVDSTKQKGRTPFTFVVGEKETIPGIDAGVVGLKAGGKQLLVIPPKLGLPYGSENIPAGSLLKAEVTILKVKKGKG